MTGTLIGRVATRLSCAAAALLLASPAHAQGYDTPGDHRRIEDAVATWLDSCFADERGYEGDLSCANAAYETCMGLSPHGESTAGLSICGGLTSNVLDREMNAVWGRLRQGLTPAAFQALRERQREWLAFRSEEARAAADRYAAGSMGAYSGWVRYNALTADRLARLREMALGS